MAYLPVTVRNRYLSYMTFPRYNSRTITSREVYLEELEKVYQQGYALDNEEELSGVICVGAPVLNYTGYPCGSIWISGPKDRLTEEQLRSTVQIVKEIAGQISAELQDIEEYNKRSCYKNTKHYDKELFANLLARLRHIFGNSRKPSFLYYRYCC